MSTATAPTTFAPAGDTAEHALARHVAQHEAYVRGLLDEAHALRERLRIHHSTEGAEPTTAAAAITAMQKAEQKATAVRRLGEVETELARAVAQRETLESDWRAARAARPDAALEAHRRGLIDLAKGKVSEAGQRAARYGPVLAELDRRAARAGSDLERAELDRQRGEVLRAQAAAEAKVTAAEAELRKVAAS